MIEINSTENAVVQNCVFDGPTYTVVDDRLYNEQIQLDRNTVLHFGWKSDESRWNCKTIS